MTKKYGSFGGSAPEPSTEEAIGGWNNAEVYRQRELGKWPRTTPFPRAVPSTIVYATCSGVVTNGISDSSFLVPNGQAVSRDAFGALFDTIGTTFGSGDGSTTFNLPNYGQNFEKCFKYVTDSGVVPSNVVGSGVLPYHTHTTLISKSQAVNKPKTLVQPTTGTWNLTVQNTSITLSTVGSDAGNAPARRYLAPLIATSGFYLRTGMVVPMILSSANDVVNQLGPAVIIASGQEVLRSEYSELFTLMGTEYGSGDGSTTFNLPDLRGAFTAIPNDLTRPSGADVYPSTFASHRHQENIFLMPFTTQYQNDIGPNGLTDDFRINATGSAFTGTENRPNNFCAIFCLVTNNIR